MNLRTAGRIPSSQAVKLSGGVTIASSPSPITRQLGSVNAAGTCRRKENVNESDSIELGQCPAIAMRQPQPSSHLRCRRPRGGTDRFALKPNRRPIATSPAPTPKIAPPQAPSPAGPRCVLPATIPVRLALPIKSKTTQKRAPISKLVRRSNEARLDGHQRTARRGLIARSRAGWCRLLVSRLCLLLVQPMLQQVLARRLSKTGAKHPVKLRVAAKPSLERGDQ